MTKKPSNLTPWFPADVRPARKGVYIRRYPDGHAYSKWDGRGWCMGRLVHVSGTLEIAATERKHSFRQDLQWRGLAEQPK